MKKALLISFTMAVLIGLCAFVNPKESTKKEEGYCVDLECKKDPNCNNGCVWYRFKEVIYANNEAHAREIASNKHPGCRVGAAVKGSCQ